MIRYECDKCGARLTANDANRFIVKMEVYAAAGHLEFDADAVENASEELDALLSQLRSADPDEIEDMEIEISILTTPQPLEYEAPHEIPNLLVPGLDGVTIVHGLRRATFLPQVWEKVEGPEHFLTMLCQKALLPAEAWKRGELEISTYRVECFHRPPPNKTAEE